MSTTTDATTGLFYQLRMMMDDVKCGAISGLLAGETEVLRENLQLCSPQIHDLTWVQTWAATVESQ
jgi:hypothetical protein